MHIASTNPAKKRRSAHCNYGLVVFLLLISWSWKAEAQSERKLIRSGNKLYQEKKFSEAENDYKKSLDVNKKSVEGNYNLGNAYYKQGKFEEAGQQFQSAAGENSISDENKAKIFHNLGNSMLKEKKYEESINAYKNSLKLNPKDNDTRYNLAYAKAMLQQQQQQQQQQNKDNKNQDKKDQQNKDQQNKDQQNKDKQKQQDQQQKDQDQQKQDQSQARNKKDISKEDAEKILQALNNDEKDTQKKLTKKQAVRISIEKEW